jgi:hypothetical protein
LQEKSKVDDEVLDNLEDSCCIRCGGVLPWK